MLRRLLASTVAMVAGCTFGRLEQRTKPAAPFDTVIVLGCPSAKDGHPSRCQLSRAIWAALLWERGWANSFITSGSHVHTPYFESDAIAQIMTALGVPPDRIYLERDALHTDENMYFSMRIAQKLGLRTVGVASQRAHALWACRMMLDWGHDCRAIPVDLDAVKARRDRAPHIDELVARATPITVWHPMAERESARTGERRRPPSWVLYPAMALMKARGEVWVPRPRSTDVEIRTWADALAAELAAPGLPHSPR